MNEMMSNDTTFSWGWVIFLILILWFFVGGNGFGFGGYGNRAGSFLAGDILGQLQGRDASLSCGASNCEVERRGLITAAETNYRIIDQAQQTRNVVEATSATTNAKIDFYAYQDLRDKLSESQRENMMLQNKLYSDAKFGAIEAQLASISCRMAKQPEVYATSAVCPNAAVINGLGINGMPYGFYGCGCNGNVLS
jgi:hypothetical protein|uniref:Uncharacterized protein n=1 Tax=Myoviridae sp. ctWb16 TaxID=2827690 RepID=A0A8S5T010_9CAUD|nr:MAG TPA: hypothetical protein [Myoviridae sp. ctWb16]